MDDLDFIKRHQMRFLKRREDAWRFEGTMYLETAGWFFLWVRQALGCLGEDEVEQQVARVLGLPSFVAAHAYWQDHPEDMRESAMLLREANPKLYVESAKRANAAKKSWGQRLYQSLRRVYATV